MQKDVFNLYSRYYDLFYSDKNYTKEVDYVDGVVRKFSPHAKRIIEYGSGTGGHGLILQKKGYSILGIERSAEMARIAQRAGLKCEVGDILTHPITEKFDVCLALFHVVSYINHNRDLVSLFNKTRVALETDGLFIFDIWFTPAVMNQVPETRVKKVEDDLTRVTRLAKPVIDFRNNIVQVNYEIFVEDKSSGTIKTLSESHNMRHFSAPEIELLAGQTGFEVIAIEEFLTGRTPSNETWGVNFILKAK
jgi:SAM-dependent methyltransferase